MMMIIMHKNKKITVRKRVDKIGIERAKFLINYGKSTESQATLGRRYFENLTLVCLLFSVCEC